MDFDWNDTKNTLIVYDDAENRIILISKSKMRGNSLLYHFIIEQQMISNSDRIFISRNCSFREVIYILNHYEVIGIL